MKILFLFISLFISINQTLKAQNPLCDCKKDLDFVIERLEKTPSYKKQIKGERLERFENTYNRIVSQMKNEISIGKCFKLISEQVDEINDFHLNIFFNHRYFNADDIENEEIVNQFLNSKIFLNHPKSTADLVRLESKLNKTELVDIEGIYKYGRTEIIVGIHKTSKKHIEGVVLSSDQALWKRGQVLFTGQLNQFGRYNLLQYDLITRQLKRLVNIIYENGRLASLKRTDAAYNYEFYTDKSSNWEFKKLEDDVQYVYFGSFSNSKKNVKAFKDFYKAHKKSFSAANIIVDLRSNMGGNDDWSDPFLKLFKRSKAKLFILTNSFTGSNGEHFTLKLKKINNAIHLGQTTYGGLAYGNNYGKMYTCPSSYISSYPTDMNYHKYINYEGYGIQPEIKLDFEKDWLVQTLEHIAGNQ